MLQGSSTTNAVAKRLRQSMSSAEVALWLALRERPAGLKFRRQHPSGPYVADFYCHAARLVIEVDGTAHDFGNRPTRDAARDGWFAARGPKTLRVPAADIYRDTDAVVAHITALAATRLVDQE